MASISDALSYMADREVQITQRQRQGMEFALNLASFEADKSFRERQFQQGVFAQTLDRQYKINEEALGQEVGSFMTRLASSADIMSDKSYEQAKEDQTLNKYQKALMDKGGFSIEDSQSVMAVLSGYYSGDASMSKNAQRVASNLAIRIGTQYQEAQALQSVDYWERVTGKSWVDAGLIGGSTEQERSLNNMSINNIIGAMQNKSNLDQEFLDMEHGDYNLDVDLYELAMPEIDRTSTPPLPSKPQLGAKETVATLNENILSSNQKIKALKSQLVELRVQASQGVDVTDQIADINAKIEDENMDLKRIEVLKDPAQKKQKSEILIGLAKGQKKYKLKSMLAAGEIDQKTYDDLMILHDERMDEKWDKLFNQDDMFIY
tara:strand:+ start:583 stop:1713 length:1131 start_codon:yes stop_codon:yes gene_type:complete